eukprot:237769-Amorphochlora_amoeboformis.AAC.2
MPTSTALFFLPLLVHPTLAFGPSPASPTNGPPYAYISAKVAVEISVEFLYLRLARIMEWLTRTTTCIASSHDTSEMG